MFTDITYVNKALTENINNLYLIDIKYFSVYWKPVNQHESDSLFQYYVLKCIIGASSSHLDQELCL